MLTAGLGGIWVELLDDVASRLLPATHGEVLAMLGSLRGQVCVLHTLILTRDQD